MTAVTTARLQEAEGFSTPAAIKQWLSENDRTHVHDPNRQGPVYARSLEPFGIVERVDKYTNKRFAPAHGYLYSGAYRWRYLFLIAKAGQDG